MEKFSVKYLHVEVKGSIMMPDLLRPVSYNSSQGYYSLFKNVSGTASLPSSASTGECVAGKSSRLRKL